MTSLSPSARQPTPAVPLALLPSGAHFSVRPGESYVRLPVDGPGGLCGAHRVGRGEEHSGAAGVLVYLPRQTRVRPWVVGPEYLAGRAGAAAAHSPREPSAEEDEWLAEREFMRTGTSSIASELEADARSARRRQ